MWNQNPKAPSNHTGMRAPGAEVLSSLTLQNLHTLAPSLLAGDVVCSNPMGNAAHKPPKWVNLLWWGQVKGAVSVTALRHMSLVERGSKAIYIHIYIGRVELRVWAAVGSSARLTCSYQEATVLSMYW